MGKADPKLGNAEPKLGKVDPKLGKSVPKLGKAGPKLGKADPGLRTSISSQSQCSTGQKWHEPDRRTRGTGVRTTKPVLCRRVTRVVDPKYFFAEPVHAA